MMLSQKTCLLIAYCFFGFKEGYVPVSAFYGEALARDISAKNLIYPVFYPLLLRRSAPYDSAPHGGIFAGA